MPRSAEEILRACNAQGWFLAASCKGYDEGNKLEALRLATVVFTLVHDGGKIHSLLSQLGAKHEIEWLSTSARAVDPQLLNRPGGFKYTPLIEYERYRDRARFSHLIPEFLPISTFLALRGSSPIFKALPFEDWWESDLVFIDTSEGAALTRKKLVFALRNQEGGSHYDPEVRDPNYKPLTRKVHMFTPGYGVGWSQGLELATMRQIAEELIVSLRRWTIFHARAA